MYKPDNKLGYLSQNLKLFCENNKLTQTDAAALFGVSEAAFRNWLNGETEPDLKSQKALEKILNAKFDKICSHILAVRLSLDHITTIEDIYPYNCIISASNYYSSSFSAMLHYESADDAELNMIYRNITPAEFDNILIKELTYREQAIIHLRYRDSNSLEEASKKIGVTRERIRQIEHKALRKINRSCIRLVERKENFNKIEEENAKLKECITKLQGAADPTRVELPKELNLFSWDTPIEDYDFSVRTYNCLKRAQLNTIRDIVTRKESFYKLRNMGRRSVEELVSLVEKLPIPYEFDYDSARFIVTDPSGLPPYTVKIN